MNDSLKPCPFCGGEAVINSRYPLGLWIVKCRQCKCKTSQQHSMTDAVKTWNRRFNL